MWESILLLCVWNMEIYPEYLELLCLIKTLSWQALGEDTDFAKPHTMRVIEKFLVDCSEAVSKRYTRYEYVQNCHLLAMREGSMFFVMWVFTVLKPKMTEKKKVTLLLKYSYWREKVLRINDQPRENALLFTQILLTLQVTVWRDRVREFVSGYWR